MKKIYFILLIISATCFKAVSQDLIIKTDKTELKAKVLELTDDNIKYKKFEMMDGPTYSINKIDVFMILYKNGTKEYIEKKQKDVTVYSQPNNSNNFFSINKSNKKPLLQSDSTENVNNYKFMGSIAIDDGFKVLDFEDYFKIKNNFYWGFSIYTSDGFFNSGGIYPYLAYKQPVAKDFFLWANAGYNYSWVGSSTVYTYAGEVNVPGSSAGGFLWEIGADYFFSKHTGITVYSPQASGLFFGLIFRRSKY